MIHLVMVFLPVLQLLLLIKVVVIVVIVQIRVALDGILHYLANVFALFLSLLVHSSLTGSGSSGGGIVLHSQRLVM